MFTGSLDYKWTGVICGNLADSVSDRWVGKLLSPITKKVTFQLTADDGGRLIINGNAIIDQWSYNSNCDYQASFDLEKDKLYDITIEHYDGSYDAYLKFYWDIDGTQKKINSRYFWLPSEIGSTRNVEVKCQSNYFKDESGTCIDCDFRCLTCPGVDTSLCQTCNTNIENLSSNDIPCECDSGSTADITNNLCVSKTSFNYSMC